MNHDRAKQIITAIKALARTDSCFSLNELRIIVALERATARLSRSRGLSEHLIFKGGFVLLKRYESHRFTRDADVLAVAISKEKLSDFVCEALLSDLEDGLWFGDVHVEELTEQGEYGAYRFDCAFQIGEPDLKKIKNLSRVHVDVGFSDRLPQKPKDQIMIAEKVQTLFDRGSANSRAKDIFDLNYLLPRCQSPGGLLTAIQKTFENRGTALPVSFAKEVGRIDKTVLSLSWPGVEVSDKPRFENAWETLMQHFEEMDRS